MSRECPISSACSLSAHCKTNDFKMVCLPKTEVFKKGQVVSYREDQSAYVILSGIGKVSFSLGNNEIFDLLLLGKGQIFGELVPFMQNKVPVELIAVNNLTVCKIAALRLREYTKRNPRVCYDLLEAVSQNYASAMQIRWIMNPPKVSGRVLRLLIVLTEIYGGEEGIPLDLTHDEIALILRTDRTSVSLALEKLYRDGLVEMGYRKIYLKNSAVANRLKRRLDSVCYKTVFLNSDNFF